MKKLLFVTMLALSLVGGASQARADDGKLGVTPDGVTWEEIGVTWEDAGVTPDVGTMP